MLGPVLERLNSEFLNRSIDRVFGIMLRAGLIPEPPEVLQGQTLKTEYISVLAQAQKQVALGGVDNFLMQVSARSRRCRRRRWTRWTSTR